jgi:hypothetical protein
MPGVKEIPISMSARATRRFGREHVVKIVSLVVEQAEKNPAFGRGAEYKQTFTVDTEKFVVLVYQDREGFMIAQIASEQEPHGLVEVPVDE